MQIAPPCFRDPETEGRMSCDPADDDSQPLNSSCSEANSSVYRLPHSLFVEVCTDFRITPVNSGFSTVRLPLGKTGIWSELTLGQLWAAPYSLQCKSMKNSGKSYMFLLKNVPFCRGQIFSDNPSDLLLFLPESYTTRKTFSAFLYVRVELFQNCWSYSGFKPLSPSHTLIMSSFFIFIMNSSPQQLLPISSFSPPIWR